MNIFQKNVRELKAKIPSDMTQEHDFLQECLNAWEGYDDSQYSYPYWQLRAVETKYALNVPDLNKKYRRTCRTCPNETNGPDLPYCFDCINRQREDKSHQL